MQETLSCICSKEREAGQSSQVTYHNTRLWKAFYTFQETVLNRQITWCAIWGETPVTIASVDLAISSLEGERGNQYTIRHLDLFPNIQQSPIRSAFERYFLTIRAIAEKRTAPQEDSAAYASFLEAQLQIVWQAPQSRRDLLHTMPYRDYLQTPEWHEQRKQAMKRAGYRCQLCNASGVRLNTHHRTYERRGYEDATDLITLCEACHSIFHENGKLAPAESGVLV